MEAIEIIVVISTLSFVLSVLGTYLYKKIKHLPTGECACCRNKGKNLIKAYKRKYKK